MCVYIYTYICMYICALQYSLQYILRTVLAALVGAGGEVDVGRLEVLAYGCEMCT